MPKKDMDWSKLVVYKICCKDLNISDIYIGSTCNLVQRRYNHQIRCNNEKDKSYNLKVYQFIRANCGWNNWCVIEIDKHPCLDSEEAKKIERYYIETLNATLNMVIPLQTQKEYYEKNKNFLLKQKKTYFKDNKDLILEKQKEKIECDCGCLICKGDLAKHKKTKKHIKLIEQLNNVVSS